MKQTSKYLAIAAILTFSSFSLPVQAQEDVAIAVVDPPRIIQQSPQGKKMQEQLQTEFSDRRKELASKQENLKGMQERLEKDAAIMSQAERQKLQSQIARLQRDLKREQENFREDLQFERNQELASIKEEVVQAIQTVAKKNGYDLVLGKGVIHASNQVNITDQVIEYLRESAG